MHIAFEYEDDDPNGATKKYVRRITWRRGFIQPALDEDGAPLGLAQNEGLDDHGRIVRLYPWHTEDDAEARTPPA